MHFLYRKNGSIFLVQAFGSVQEEFEENQGETTYELLVGCRVHLANRVQVSNAVHLSVKRRLRKPSWLFFATLQLSNRAKRVAKMRFVHCMLLK